MDEDLAREKREELKTAYAKIFCGNGTEPTKDAQIVLDDLKRFCGFELSELAVSRRGTVDVNATMARIGQKEMFLRIVHMSNLSLQPQVQKGEKDGKPRSAKPASATRAFDGLDRA